MPYQTFPITLCVLCALRGFIFNNRRVRRAHKGFCKDALPNFPHYSLRPLRPSRFILINRRVRGARKGFCNGVQLKAITHYSLRPLRPSRFHF